MLNFFIIYKYQRDTSDLNRFASGYSEQIRIYLCYHTFVTHEFHRPFER